MDKDFFIKILKTIIVFSPVLLLSACSVNVDKKTIVNQLKNFDEKIGQEVNRVNVKDASIGSVKKSGDNIENNSDILELSDKDKKKIDKWLNDNGLNKYGDSKGVVYPNGSPLFDSRTGKSIERFKYILKRYPNILKK